MRLDTDQAAAAVEAVEGLGGAAADGGKLTMKTIPARSSKT